MKKMRMLLIAVFSIHLLTGCWDRVEVNDIAIVTAVGLDLMKDGKLRLSLQVAIPSKLGPAGGGGGQGNDKDSTFLISETGNTVSEAYRNLQMKISRRIFFSQSRVLLIGENLARKGVKNIIDFHSRYHEPRINSFIMFTKGEASEILKTLPRLESVSAEETKELVKLSVGLSVYVSDFLTMLLTDGMEPLAPEFALAPLEVKEKNAQEKGQEINGTAVFKSDKLVGWIDKANTRGVLWLRNEIEHGVVTVEVPEEDGGGNVSIDITKAEVKITPNIENNMVTINVQVTSDMNVMENDSKLNLDDTKVIEDLQKNVEADIKERIQAVIDLAQKDFQADIFGFGHAIYKKYPKEWNTIYKQKWDQEFSHVEVTIQPEVFIRRIGLIK
ncbi:Ger(x)C family spore germination protein [Bacillus sp. REN16]|uniref:Ger(x)C family spore germination protein n=1 Tax=Bacillus sp. REN16 TaxID=2887296 RepID=UPI001E358714|nr:Ger(x)C family spore germination protein [Bacillus sp. REN16]MCC3359527.1 Ger(x)C family spore germination protein [Bacillus sp. REN16]